MKGEEGQFQNNLDDKYRKEDLIKARASLKLLKWKMSISGIH